MALHGLSCKAQELAPRPLSKHHLPVQGDDVALGMTSRPVQAFMGPADRSNTAAREYVAEHAMQVGSAPRSAWGCIHQYTHEDCGWAAVKNACQECVPAEWC